MQKPQETASPIVLPSVCYRWLCDGADDYWCWFVSEYASFCDICLSVTYSSHTFRSRIAYIGTLYKVYIFQGSCHACYWMVMKFWDKTSKIKVTDNENDKIIFHAYLHQKWIDLRQTKTKMISGQFHTCRRIHFIHFTSRNASFLWYLSVIIQ